MPRRYSVRRSAIHGRGVFALMPLATGDVVGRYAGRRVSWEEREPRSPETEQGHTFYFDLGDGTVIDGGAEGNSLRWLNHGCDPNCEALQDGHAIWIQTRRPVAAEEELVIDYALEVDAAEAPSDYPCRCGSHRCTGTLLSQPHGG